MKEYKVGIYQEGALGSLLLGGGKVNPVKFGSFLNANAAEGFRVVTIEREIRRMFVFFKREAMVVVFERDRQALETGTDRLDISDKGGY